MSTFETDEFKRLAREWRAKLKASGFHDIETPSEKLVKCTFHATKALDSDDAAPRARYFELARRWSSARVWPSRIERRLWDLHSEGVGVRMATILMRPMVNNAKSQNEDRIIAERRLMFQWAAAEAMQSGAEDGSDAEPPTLFDQHLSAEGWADQHDWSDDVDEQG